MASVTDICNMALMRCGSSAAISSLTEKSQEANLCNAFYAQCRDYVLRDFPWGFAQRQVALSELAATAGEANGFPSGWAYKYGYPTDCLMVHGIYPGIRNPRTDQRVPYQIMSDGATTAIYTDQETAKANYTARVVDTTLFEPMFTSALAFLLASEIALPLSVNSRIVEAARSGYAQTVREAATRNMNESQFLPVPDCELLAVRQ